MKFNIVKPTKDIMYVDKTNYQCADSNNIVLSSIKGKDNPRLVLTNIICNILELNTLETIVYNCLIDSHISQRLTGIIYPHTKRSNIIKNAIATKNKHERTYDRIIKGLIDRHIICPFPTGELYVNPIYDISVYYKQLNNTTHIVLHLI